MPRQRKNATKKTKKSTRQKSAISVQNADIRPLVPRPRQKIGRTPKSNHVRGVCSVTDPFCPASKNSKWPDGTAGNTLTEQFRGNYTLSTTSAGQAFAAFGAGAPFGYATATVLCWLFRFIIICMY